MFSIMVSTLKHPNLASLHSVNKPMCLAAARLHRVAIVLLWFRLMAGMVCGGVANAPERGGSGNGRYGLRTRYKRARAGMVCGGVANAPERGIKMEVGPDRIQTSQRGCNAINRFFLFINECSVQSVPEDESGGIVVIEILLVGSVMDAMVCWRVENKLKPFRHTLNGFGVNPILIKRNQTCGQAKTQHIKPEKRNRQKQREC